MRAADLRLVSMFVFGAYPKQVKNREFWNIVHGRLRASSGGDPQAVSWRTSSGRMSAYIARPFRSSTGIANDCQASVHSGIARAAIARAGLRRARRHAV
jgi:hypothetical protein